MKVAIIGLGVVGGSIAYALKESSAEMELLGIESNEATLEQARESRMFNSLHPTVNAALGDADVIFVCVPIAAVESVFEAIAPLLNEESVVTDVSGIKTPVEESAFRLLTTGNYVGSHPMAGSEKAGMEHARTDLFEGRPCFVTPGPDAPSEQVNQIHAFWEKLGMTVTQVEPAEHDSIVAHVSHLPHALASCLAHLLAQQPVTWGRHAGQGLRDTSRIASGDPALWEEIFSRNRDAVLHALDSCQQAIAQFKSHVEDGAADELRAFLAKGKTYRDSLPPTSQA